MALAMPSATGLSRFFNSQLFHLFLIPDGSPKRLAPHAGHPAIPPGRKRPLRALHTSQPCGISNNRRHDIPCPAG
ncbi:MAG: hypothetical protein MZV64_36990 [Ignavibacteriales bacterium]|nr:hypothetical protein [Ignavibacteriales bacterium]